MARIRTIKPEFWTDQKMSRLDALTRLVYVCLWSMADDEGRLEGDAVAVRSFGFPCQDVEQIDAAIDALAELGRIGVYTDGGNQYIQIIRWSAHQRIDKPANSKLPPPPQNHSPKIRELQGSIREDSPTIREDSPLDQGSGIQDQGSGSGIGSRSTDQDRPAGAGCGSPAKPASPPEDHSATVLNFPCVGKGATEWPLTEAKLSQYQESFPGVDVLAECRKARQWCIDHPTKRKTARGMPAFLTRWLSNAQDRPAGSVREIGQGLHDPRGNLALMNRMLEDLNDEP
jgi:hypothetical protein